MSQSHKEAAAAATATPHSSLLHPGGLPVWCSCHCVIGEHACATPKAAEISEEASAGSGAGKEECVLSAAPVSSPDIGLAELGAKLTVFV